MFHWPWRPSISWSTGEMPEHSSGIRVSHVNVKSERVSDRRSLGTYLCLYIPEEEIRKNTKKTMEIAASDWLCFVHVAYFSL